MAQNKVMNLWTAFVTALIALCTALGLITTTAAAAVPQTAATRNSSPQAATAPAMSPRSSSWSYDRSLPPTMKQRIRAEAHGKTPSCRHRPPTDVDTDPETAQTAQTAQTGQTGQTAQTGIAPETAVQDTAACDTAAPPAEPLTPLLR
jgi:hypothetical protein